MTAVASPSEVSLSAPLAHVFGEPVREMPHDLYIPPDALRVLLDSFEGPLDLLLYLIRRQNIDILDIPMAAVTTQYMQYVDAMQVNQLELAADYLLMAAMLIEIKSRLLLPKVAHSEEGDEHDPRAELVRRLLEYEQMKLAAFELDQLPQAGRDFAWVAILFERESVQQLPDVNAADLKAAWLTILSRAKHKRHHTVHADELSVREQMTHILKTLACGRYVEFVDLFDHARGVAMLVVTFTALLELVKEKMITVMQDAAYSPIYARLAGIEDLA